MTGQLRSNGHLEFIVSIPFENLSTLHIHQDYIYETPSDDGGFVHRYDNAYLAAE